VAADPNAGLPYLYHPQTGAAITLNTNVLSQAHGWRENDVIQYVGSHLVIIVSGFAGKICVGTAEAAYAAMGAAALLVVAAMSYSLFTKT
jgi:hypothetical protein